MTTLVFRVLLYGTVTAFAVADCDLGNQPIVLTDWTGSITSPGFGTNSYPNNQNCTWHIKVGSGSKIRLTFDIFEIEEGFKENKGPSGSKKCEWDSVSITDSNRSLFKDCGQRIAIEPIDSITNRVTVTFLSDEGNQMSGFRLNYTGICRMNITYPGHIELPNFPNPPPPGVECHWFLSSNKAMMIVRLAQENNDLPPCNHTPVVVRELATENVYNICLTNYLAFSHRDLELTYKVEPGDQPWGGKLEISHTKSLSCKTFCRNETTSECLDGRDLSGRGYGCICEEGYTGTNCEARLSDLDPCYSKPCHHNGACETSGATYNCSCIQGYTGKDCEYDINECLEDGVCQNGGTCINNPGSYYCACADGYIGSKCHTEIWECSSNPCPQNSTCQDKVGFYVCLCPDGYTGKMCDILTCGTNPCQNGGSCTDVDTGFLCTCVKGYKGKVCDVRFNKCDWEPCQHGGTCVTEAPGFHCLCSEEYTGRSCSIHKDSAHCLEDTDVVFGSGITWVDTLANHEDVQKCPPGILGFANRMCVYNSLSTTGGSWVRPDLSKCVSPQILQINKEANLLRSNDSVSSGEILDVARRLVIATSVVQDHRGARLYPGDLAFATGIIETIADVILKTTDVTYQMTRMVKGYGEAVDNLVDPSTAIIWKNARASLVDEKVSSLLSSTEMLAYNLWSQFEKKRRRRAAGLQSSSDAGDDSNVDVTSKNMEFAIWNTRGRQNATKLPAFFGRLGFSSIQLPEVVVDIARKGHVDSDVSFYYGKFPTVAALLSIREERHNRTHSDNATVVNSDVVSCKVLGVSEGSLQDLKQHVVITFAYKNVSLRKSLQETCVFLNLTAGSSSDRWSTDGCHLDSSSNATHAVCRCNHLTNFALLMDVYGTSKSLDDVNDSALSAISYIGGCLSILACIISIIVFEYFRLRNDRIRIHEHLAASIILVQVVFLLGFGRVDNHIPIWACKTVAVLMHFFLTAMFCWMLVEGIHLYVALVRVFKRGNHLKKYLAIGWGVPLVVVGISFAVFYDHYGNGDICWLNRDTLLVCFVPTVGLVVVINTIVLIIVLKVMMRSLHSTTKVTVQEKSSLKMGLKATAILLPLLGLTWTLAFFTISSEREIAIVFTYLFTISNSFQGVMFFVFHCLLNVDVHSAFERRYPRRKTISSIDTSMSKFKRSSSLGVTLDESALGKASIKTQFTDISMNESRHSSCSSSGLLHVENRSTSYNKSSPSNGFLSQPSAQADSSYNGHLQLTNRPSAQSNSSSNGHLRLVSRSSAQSNSSSNGHLRAVNRMSVQSSSNSHDHLPLDRHSSGFEDFNEDEAVNIWRTYSLEKEEAFPEITKRDRVYHPDGVFVSSWGLGGKPRRNSTTFSDFGAQL